MFRMSDGLANIAMKQKISIMERTNNIGLISKCINFDKVNSLSDFAKIEIAESIRVSVYLRANNLRDRLLYLKSSQKRKFEKDNEKKIVKEIFFDEFSKWLSFEDDFEYDFSNFCDQFADNENFNKLYEKYNNFFLSNFKLIDDKFNRLEMLLSEKKIKWQLKIEKKFIDKYNLSENEIEL